MDSIRILTVYNEDMFFSECKVGEVFNYTQVFTLKDVLKLADKNGVIIRYCPPKSKEYIKHGSYTCKVLSVPEKRTKIIVSASEKNVLTF
jgi:hypothetical protein